MDNLYYRLIFDQGKSSSKKVVKFQTRSRNAVKYGKYSLAKFEYFLSFCINRSGKPKVVAISARNTII